MPLHDYSPPLPPGAEIGYDQITAGVTVVSTTEATGTTIISCPSRTFDGAPVMVQLRVGYLQTGTNASAVIVCLFEGATEIGRLAVLSNAVNQIAVTNYTEYRFTPSAGPHTYTITAFISGSGPTGTPAIGGGPGGTAAYLPTYVRFVKV